MRSSGYVSAVACSTISTKRTVLNGGGEEPNSPSQTHPQTRLTKDHASTRWVFQALAVFSPKSQPDLKPRAEDVVAVVAAAAVVVCMCARTRRWHGLVWSSGGCGCGGVVMRTCRRHRLVWLWWWCGALAVAPADAPARKRDWMLDALLVTCLTIPCYQVTHSQRSSRRGEQYSHASLRDHAAHDHEREGVIVAGDRTTNNERREHDNR